MSSELKRELCDILLKNNLVEIYQFIKHSYTNDRLSGGMGKDRYVNICPTLTTRCDCLGVVCEDTRLGGKNENNN